MIKTIILSMCLAVSSLSLNARAQDVRQYTDGPVTGANRTAHMGCCVNLAWAVRAAQIAAA
jgi:hypothetical protein